MASLIISADAQDVVLDKIQLGDKVILVAANKSEKPQLVTLDMTLENVLPDKKLPLEVVLRAGEKKEILVLSPIPLKAWTYRTKYSYEEFRPDNEIATPRPDNQGIVKNTPIVINDERPLVSREVKDYYKLPPANSDDEPMPAFYARSMNQPTLLDKQDQSPIPKSELLLFGQAGCSRCTMARNYFSEQGISYKDLNITGNDENQQLMNKYLFDSGFEGGQFTMPVVVVEGQAHYSIKNLEGFLLEMSSGN